MCSDLCSDSCCQKRLWTAYKEEQVSFLVSSLHVYQDEQGFLTKVERGKKEKNNFYLIYNTSNGLNLKEKSHNIAKQQGIS